YEAVREDVRAEPERSAGVRRLVEEAGLGGGIVQRLAVGAAVADRLQLAARRILDLDATAVGALGGPGCAERGAWSRCRRELAEQRSDRQPDVAPHERQVGRPGAVHGVVPLRVARKRPAHLPALD